MGACALHYEVGGNAHRPPLLFLHGFMGSSHDWLETVAMLDDFRCILPDLPGHGRTAACRSPIDYTMAAAATALVRLLDELRVSTCTPIGYSMGGRLALYLAVAHPDRCERVVMESASLDRLPVLSGRNGSAGTKAGRPSWSDGSSPILSACGIASRCSRR